MSHGGRLIDAHAAGQAVFVHVLQPDVSAGGCPTLRRTQQIPAPASGELPRGRSPAGTAQWAAREGWLRQLLQAKREAGGQLATSPTAPGSAVAARPGAAASRSDTNP